MGVLDSRRINHKQERLDEIWCDKREPLDARDQLEDVLDAIHGPDWGPQLPGHYGNGKPEEKP